MQYYHFYRTTNDEKPRLNDAGWVIRKIDSFDLKELERHTAYRAKYIHRFVIPETAIGRTQYKKANTYVNWREAANNPLVPVSGVQVDKADVAYEIEFDKGLNPEEYHIKQEYPKEFDIYVEGSFLDRPVIPRPKTLELGQKLYEIILEKDEVRNIPIS